MANPPPRRTAQVVLGLLFAIPTALLGVSVLQIGSRVQDTVELRRRTARFLLLSRPGSGSHFVRSLLQRDSRCLVDDVMHRASANETAWSEDVDRAFESLLARTSLDTRTVGLLMHYNQLWCHGTHEAFADCMMQFGRWAKRRSIRVVHLAREAALMNVASDYDQRLVANATTTAVRSLALNITPAVLSQVDELEFEIQAADHALPTLGVPYHYLRYESLLDADARVAALARTRTFLDLEEEATWQEDVIASAFDNVPATIAIDRPTCASRVASWNTSQWLLAASTRNACAALDDIVRRSLLLVTRRG